MENINPRKENPGLLDETVGKSLQNGVRLVLENLLSVLVWDRRGFSVYVCVVENVEDFDAHWGVDGSNSDKARSALSKFDA
jgi:hypothetical protein